MEDVLDMIVQCFQKCYILLDSVQFSVDRFHVSLLWILISLLFMSIVFNLFLPFIHPAAVFDGRSVKGTSERIKDTHLVKRSLFGGYKKI